MSEITCPTLLDLTLPKDSIIVFYSPMNHVQYFKLGYYKGAGYKTKIVKNLPSPIDYERVDIMENFADIIDN